MIRMITLMMMALRLIAPSSGFAKEPVIWVSSFSEQGAIHSFQLDSETASLRKLSTTRGVRQPFFIRVSSDGQYLYSTHCPEKFGGATPDEVVAFKVDVSHHELTLLNRRSTEGRASCYLGMSPDGKTLGVASYESGDVASFRIQEDGRIGHRVSYHPHRDEERRELVSHAHCLVVSPEGDFAYAADLGLNQIFVYQVDPETSAFELIAQGPAVQGGCGPRHLAFDPVKGRIYVVNELSSSVTIFERDQSQLSERETVSTLPEGFRGKNAAGDLKITADGRHLYATNRGHDSIAHFVIDDAGGLTLKSIVPSGGDFPQSLAITSEQKFLLCANMKGNCLIVFAIHGESGELTRVGMPVEIKSPACLQIVGQ